MILRFPPRLILRQLGFLFSLLFSVFCFLFSVFCFLFSVLFSVFFPIMQTIEIPSILLAHPAHYMQKDGHYDVLGCLLLSKGISIPDKTKFPSQLKQHIPPFTVECRRSFLDSKLTLDILKLLSTHPRKELLGPLNDLLRPHNIEVKFV